MAFLLNTGSLLLNRTIIPNYLETRRFIFNHIFNKINVNIITLWGYVTYQPDSTRG